MLNLIIKDILIQKKTIALGLVYAAIMTVAFGFGGTAMFTAATFAVVFLLIQTPCAYDDKNHADVLLNSLPIKRETVVTARYLSVLLYISISVVEYLVIYYLIKLSTIPLPVANVSMETIVGLLAVVAVFVSLFYPIYFRFGYLKTRYINIVLFCGLFAGGSILIDAIGKEGFGKTASAFLNSQPDWIIGCGILGIGLALVLVSYLLSLRFYLHREF